MGVGCGRWVVVGVVVMQFGVGGELEGEEGRKDEREGVC